MYHLFTKSSTCTISGCTCPCICKSLVTCFSFNLHEHSTPILRQYDHCFRILAVARETGAQVSALVECMISAWGVLWGVGKDEMLVGEEG